MGGFCEYFSARHSHTLIYLLCIFEFFKYWGFPRWLAILKQINSVRYKIYNTLRYLPPDITIINFLSCFKEQNKIYVPFPSPSP